MMQILPKLFNFASLSKKVAIILMVVFSFTTPAQADLKICNYVSSNVNVAIGYKVKSGWTTEGWWLIEPNSCETILEGDLFARFYYVYAIEEGTGGYWDGEAVMCTKNEKFTINGIADCELRGYRRTGFTEVDTGDWTNWELKLTPDK
ncbi:MAG: DUF1036 domain-containing protein [Hyphomicrobiales bacterium]|nr:DUF1036 domain-containing protein [Hyphomicrobiales bacterium]